MVRSHGSLSKDDETNEAAWEAAKGAAIGATKWGAVFAIGSGLGLAFSPLYRSFTVQFKTYIQMSGMILGGYLEADKRFVAYGHQMRYRKSLARDAETWRRYEQDFEERGTPGVAGEGGVHGKGGE